MNPLVPLSVARTKDGVMGVASPREVDNPSTECRAATRQAFLGPVFLTVVVFFDDRGVLRQDDPGLLRARIDIAIAALGAKPDPS